ncbi:hypothetical protein TNCV_2903901 [Trichonephila clavipes]|nr:hypothetical protein TNCV_2903901 [Trichonephila clavipes]
MNLTFSVHSKEIHIQMYPLSQISYEPDNSCGVDVGRRARFHPRHLTMAQNCEVRRQKQMFQSSGQSGVELPVFSSQASLVLIYRPAEEMKS